MFKPGQVVKFSYKHRSPVDSESGDSHKEVLILHPNWVGKVHGIDLKRLSPAEREVLRAVMDPKAREKTHRLPLVNDIVRKMDVLKEIRNPVPFYSKFVKPFLRNKDAYRTYYQSAMIGITVIDEITAVQKPENTKPLFGPKPGQEQEKQPTPAERMQMIRDAARKLQTQPVHPAQSRLDMIQAAAEKLRKK